VAAGMKEERKERKIVGATKNRRKWF